MDAEQEREANLFAVCLLMPESLLRRDIKKMGGIDLCDDGAVAKLAKLYRVSTSMMAARIGQLFFDASGGQKEE